MTLLGSHVDKAADQAAHTLARVERSCDAFDALIAEARTLIADMKTRGVVIRLALDEEPKEP